MKHTVLAFGLLTLSTAFAAGCAVPTSDDATDDATESQADAYTTHYVSCAHSGPEGITAVQLDVAGTQSFNFHDVNLAGKFDARIWAPGGSATARVQRRVTASGMRFTDGTFSLDISHRSLDGNHKRRNFASKVSFVLASGRAESVDLECGGFGAR